MPRILSRIINALIGTSESDSGKKEAQAAQEGKKEAETAQSKDWVPEVFTTPKAAERFHAQYQMPTPPKAQEVHEKDVRSLEAEHGGAISGIFRALAKAFDKIHGYAKNQKVILASPFLIAAAIVILSLTPFFSYVKAAIIVILLILAGAASKLIQKLFPFVVGFDLCLFFTVLAGVAYHPFAGILVGVLSSTLGSIVRGQHDAVYVIMPDVGYLIVGLSLTFFSGTSIFYTGIISALIYAITMSVIFWFIMQNAPNTLTFLVTTIAFNYWLFSNYAAGLLSAMVL